jgi:hypothetical protein
MASEPTLYARMELRLTDFERKLAKATKSSDQAMGRIERESQSMRQKVEKQFGAMGSAAAGFARSLAAPLLALGATGAIRTIVGIADSVARVGDEARRAGLSVEAFQELKYVAEQNRVGVDALIDGFKELNLRADEWIVTGGGSAAEAFARLGFSAEELNTKLQDPSALFSEIIGKLQGLDQAAQIRIADELFGGSGGEQFVQLIGQGEAGIRNTIQAAHDLGVVMSAETIARADELDRKFNAIATTVSSHLRQAIVDAAGALDAFLNSFGETPAQHFGEVNARIAEQVQLIHDLGAAGGREFPAIAEHLATIVGGLDATGSGAIEAQAALHALAANPDYSPLIGDLNGVIATLIHLTGQARAAQAAITAASSDPVGTMPAFSALSTLRRPTTVPGSGAPPSAGGSGASAAATEAKAVLDLIATLEHERTTIGLSAKELAVANALRNAGTAATDEQRVSIEALVAGNFDLAAAQDAATASLDQMQDLARNVLGGMVDDLVAGKDAADVFANALSSIGNQLLDMGMGALLGTGGGDFGFLGEALGLKAATGGRVTGPGTGTSDSIPARLSNGEFVVNAKSTKDNLALLHAINGGGKGYALGGLVGAPGPVRGASGGGGPAVVINIPIDATGADAAGLARVERKVAELKAELPGIIKTTVSRRPKDIW